MGHRIKGIALVDHNVPRSDWSKARISGELPASFTSQDELNRVCIAQLSSTTMKTEASAMTPPTRASWSAPVHARLSSLDTSSTTCPVPKRRFQFRLHTRCLSLRLPTALRSRRFERLCRKNLLSCFSGQVSAVVRRSFVDVTDDVSTQSQSTPPASTRTRANSSTSSPPRASSPAAHGDTGS